MVVPRSTGAVLGTFVRKYSRRANVGDTETNRGQCVGLVEAWIDFLGLPHIWGNAKDLLDNAPTASYEVILNSPTNYPEAGDIVVWDGSWGGGCGHCAVAVVGDVMYFHAFEQNDPEGSTPHLKMYLYAGVLGWLHPLRKP